MPWSGGQFTRIHDWVDDKNAGIPITASRMDADSDDFTSGINNCIAKDGSNTPTANLNIGSFRLASVGNATALTDGPNLGQLQAGVTNWGVVAGTADALTLTLSPAQTTIADGTLVCIRAGLANATTAPTFAFNATTARTITRYGGKPLAPGDIPGALAESWLRYNVANTRWELLNPAKGVTYPIARSGASVSVPADTTEDILATITLPANALGANGFIRFRALFGLTNDANAKTFRLRIGGIGGTVISTFNFANQDAVLVQGELHAVNATNSQLTNSTAQLTSGTFATPSYNAVSAIDTTAATTFVITGQKASAGNTMRMDGYLSQIFADGT